MIARVLVDVPVKAVDRLFDYEVPDFLREVIELGMRVSVNFGNRVLMGYVLELAEKSDYQDEIKPLRSVLDLESYLTEELIDLAWKLHSETATVMIKVIETILPAALRATYKTRLEVVDPGLLPDSLKPSFLTAKTVYLGNELDNVMKEVKNALSQGAIRQKIEIKSKSGARNVRVVKLLSSVSEAKTARQNEVLEYLRNTEKQSESMVQLTKRLKVSPSVIEALEKNGLVKIESQEEYRELFSLIDMPDKTIVLNQEQQEAYMSINAKLNENVTFLIHGVTGSGKTEIYLKAIADVIASGKEAILLVPEISLTPMMVSRFKNRFGDNVAVLHSGLSIGEKFDEWRKIIRHEVKIAIGARSACFAPFTNLGLLVVDECHESSYKQDEMPKYYALDVLEERSKYYHIPIILGSATPNIESYARHKRGYYELLELKNRALNARLPDLEIVDMKTEFKQGNSRLISELLRNEINLRLDRNEQTILLLNRRGYSTFVICRNCGHVFTCPNCDISLTYHEADHTLKCHYCNHKEPVPKICPKCDSTDLRYFGSGTQKIETELQELFPEAKIVRMDSDTTKTKNAHEKLLYKFENEGDILLGTQMIAKGLDFPRVTLVGIIQADGNLYSPDFRAPERTFQLITQVAGRAGRRDVAGKVIIQAFNPNHYAIKYAFEHDYKGFYEYEMQLRKLAKYVPFYYLTQIVFAGEKMRDLFIAAKAAVKQIKELLSLEAIVLGPSLPLVPKIRNLYSCQIIIKYRHEPNLNQVLAKIKSDYENELIRVTIDKSPSLS
ncbi:MAG: primosomal protein N' [Bacilli bacterium]|nr:primosomal protein N' [Bacilli bacterium]MBN2696291.1 primosomal protein N' [Bacilli bacterium]